MAHGVALRQAEDPGIWPECLRPPADDPPRGWDTATDGAHAIWWRWLDAPPGTRPNELGACWYRVDDLGMGIGLYLPRRLGGRAVDVDDELLNVVRLVDLEGWTRRKTGRRLYRELDDPKAEARSRLKSGRAQLAAAGVLPWAVWPGGKLPSGWWSDPETHVAIMAWREAAVLVGDDVRSLGRIAQGAAGHVTGLAVSVMRVAGLPRLRALAP